MHKTRLKAILRERIKLNLDNGDKNIFHLSLEIDPNTFSFNTGSCITIHPKNPKELLNKFFTLLEFDPNKSITHPKTKETLTVYSFFENHVNFYQTRATLIKKIINPDTETLRALSKKDLITFLLENKDRLPSLEEIISHTAPLLPRYYSISSSQQKDNKRLDLMVSAMTFNHEHIKMGIASGYLTEQIQIGDTIEFSYHENPKFCLPECQKTPIIMIGPGTGLAPFRGFLHDLETRPNPAWLFTGAQKKQMHFYYKNELLEHADNNELKLSHAFSRDQEEKRYVQHLMLDESETIFSWIEEKKAIIYICGDAKNMAKDVQNALKQIIIQHKNITEAQAKEHLKEMRKEGRLNLDVY